MTFRAPDGTMLYGLWCNTSDTMCHGLTRDRSDPWDPLRGAEPCKCSPGVRLQHVATYEPVENGVHVRACLEHMRIIDTGFRMVGDVDFEYVDVP